MTAERSPAIRIGVLAYGDDLRLHREATVSLLTIREFAPPDATLVLFTNQPRLYKWIAGHVTVEQLSDAVVKAWRGPTDDRFRPKIEALRHLSEDGAHALLADTDTMARTTLAPLVAHLDEGGFVLYEREYPIASPPRRGDRRLQQEVVGKRWDDIPADHSTWMWNGGVIGVSAHHPDAARRALIVFDKLRQASTHFALEQLAYSIVFPALGPVRAASDCFIHYWANRAWFDRRIERFLGQALMEGLPADLAAARLREAPIDGPLDGRLSSWQRRVRKMFRIEMDDDTERIG